MIGRKESKKRDYIKHKEAYIKRAGEWRINNPEKRKITCRNWRWRARLEVIDAYGGKCACCGETIPEFLSIDHINNDGYKLRKEGKQLVGGSFYRWLKTQGYPKDNFQLLCMNCNFAKGHFGHCPHNDITHRGNKLLTKGVSNGSSETCR